MEDLITIGKITRNQGNKGEVRVLPLTDIPARFKMIAEVYLVNEDQITRELIEDIRFHKNFVIMKLKGIDNIEEALKFKDWSIKIPQEMLLPLAENRFYIFELLNYRVLTAEGDYLGEVVDILKTGGTDIFLVKGQEKEYMIPAAEEILEIKPDDSRIIVSPPPGLLDL